MTLGLWRRLLHLLLLWRSRTSDAYDGWRHHDVMRLNDHLRLNLWVSSHNWWWWHMSGHSVMRMGNMHWRFAHRLHLARHLLWSERWRWLVVIDRCSIRILPHGALGQRLRITIYIHTTAIRHVSSTVSIHFIHITVTIYNR